MLKCFCKVFLTNIYLINETLPNFDKQSNLVVGEILYSKHLQQWLDCNGIRQIMVKLSWKYLYTTETFISGSCYSGHFASIRLEISQFSIFGEITFLDKQINTSSWKSHISKYYSLRHMSTVI